MLTDPNHPAGPELAPLVIGSPVARALHDLWVGCWSLNVVVEDLRDRIHTAATISAHLAMRAGIRVRLAVDIELQTLAVLAVMDQVPSTVVCCPNGSRLWARGRAIQSVVDNESAVIITPHALPPVIGYDIRVVLTDQGQAAHIYQGRSVTVSGEPFRFNDTAHDHHRLRGDLPLDIAIAGAP